jgi:predicted dinucleotide-binding enzyme
VPPIAPPLIPSDDDEAKSEAAAIIDRLGFDTVDAGMLSDSWKV